MEQSPLAENHILCWRQKLHFTTYITVRQTVQAERFIIVISRQQASHFRNIICNFLDYCNKVFMASLSYCYVLTRREWYTLSFTT